MHRDRAGDFGERVRDEFVISDAQVDPARLDAWRRAARTRNGQEVKIDMTYRKGTRVLGLLGVSVLAACSTAGSGTDTATPTAYDVTITNNSPQVVTPPLVIAHQSGFSVFEVGQPASEALVVQAETGDPSALAAKVGGMADVGDAVAGAGPVPPGQSVTIRVTAGPGARYLTATGMFATTNDAFFGVQSVALPTDSAVKVVGTTIYDAGSEANNELCSHIPGPPCAGDSGNARAAGEGSVQPHPGLTGSGDLDPSLNWAAGAVQLAIRAVN